jgi:hypothetical protein
VLGKLAVIASLVKKHFGQCDISLYHGCDNDRRVVWMCIDEVWYDPDGNILPGQEEKFTDEWRRSVQYEDDTRELGETAFFYEKDESQPGIYHRILGGKSDEQA